MAVISPGAARSDPYAVLVSEFMLQQTQVATVISVLRRVDATLPRFRRSCRRVGAAKFSTPGRVSAITRELVIFTPPHKAVMRKTWGPLSQSR